MSLFSFTSRSGLALGAGLVLVLTSTARAGDMALASDLSVHGPTIDLRPLNDGQGAKATGSPALSLTSSDASSPDPLPQNTDVTSNSVPNAGPGANSDSALSSPAANASTEVAANGIAPLPGAGPKVAELPPSPNATINLINLMVKRNLISRDDADGLIRQSEQEADNARAQAATTQATAERALTTQQAPAAPAEASAPAASDDEVRVTYVPDVVKKQITDQVTQNVMEETREEHLADSIAANQVPDWVKRLHVGGDVRLRFEDDMFPDGSAVGNFTNFNAINTSASGFNVNTTSPVLPQYNADQDRVRFRLRARIGAGIDLGENFTAGLRIATGSDDDPTTENQTLGLANNSQGGNFARYQIWLDRAFLRYEWGGTPQADASLTVGRFDNPFISTSMIWADDLGFDGVVAKGSYQVAPGVTPFLTAGAFPTFNTDFNFSTNQSVKFDSEDKYLFAAQGGTKWTINKDFSFTGAAAIYDFENIEGKVSDPIDNAALNAGDTDDSRPSFAQNGNTYIALRNYTDPTIVPGVTVENQFYGLASEFRVLALTGQLDFARFDPFHMSVTGEFIDNLAFDRNSIINGGPTSDPGPQNNTTSSNPDSFDGGNIGYMIHIDAGKVALQERWDWNVRLSYRYVQTDATVDAFTDSDFGAPLYGTNLKGFTVGGNLALSKRVWFGLRYMSADNVSGPTFHSDLVQFDLNAKF
jgi:hypothetical protein